jgi:hypothetical protein
MMQEWYWFLVTAKAELLQNHYHDYFSNSHNITSTVAGISSMFLYNNHTGPNKQLLNEHPGQFSYMVTNQFTLVEMHPTK